MNKTLEQVKISTAVATLLKHGLNQSRAAKELDISRGTLRKLVAQYTGEDKGTDLNERVLNKYIARGEEHYEEHD